MHKYILFVITLFLAVSLNAQQSYWRTLILMGNRFDITVVANDSLKANKYIQRYLTPKEGAEINFRKIVQFSYEGIEFKGERNRIQNFEPR